MKNIFDRLQFVKGQYHDANGNLINDGIFLTREDAINYVIESQFDSTWPTVVAEPIVLRYESGSALKGPNVILAIGSVGVGKPQRTNRTFFIDIQKTEEEIEALDEKIEEAIKTLALLPIDSDTLDLSIEKTDDGTILSGDVKIADYRVVDGKINYNIIQTEGDKGIYAFVDMDYDPETFAITFNVNGVTKEFQLPTDRHVAKGWYSPKDEAIILKLADNSQVSIQVSKLIEEWTVLPDGQTIKDYDVSGHTVNFTPIVLSKTHVGSKETEHEGIYEWQDVLEADVRVADHITDNIIHKDKTGRYLYVKGTADNIKYKDGMSVKDALDNVDTKVSTSAGNLIYKRPDGIYATAMLNYNAAENKLIYTFSDGNSAEIKSVEFKLNSVKILEDITYDPVKEVIVIRYIDAQGEYQRVEIPASDIIEEWEVDNEAHNIQLNKYRSEGKGKDILTADAKIHAGNNNILEDLNHELYVNGISNNIKYDVTGATTVKDVLDNLSATTDSLNDKIDQEIDDRTADVERIDNTIGSGFTTDVHENITYKFESLYAKVDSEIERSTTKDEELETAINNEVTRSTDKDSEHDEAIERIDTTIGSGFTTDEHETVTYKFEQLQNKVNEEAEKLQNEINRSTSADTVHDGRLDAIDAEIGNGFGPRNTVRDEIDNLQNEIDAVSADTSMRLTDVINEDKSIDVETRTDENDKPTIKVLKVNLSEEVEDDKPNIIKLNADGLYAGVDLIYEFNEEVGTNQLIFKTTNGTKTYDLKTNSVVDKIYYDPIREAIIIEYTINGHRMPDVVIPVGDLINEWRVEDGHPHAIQLEKVRVASGTSEQDVLKASVIITDDHDDNILVMDDGALYVSGSGITANKADIDALKERMTAAENDIDSLEVAINNEISARTLADEALGRRIDQEISDRIADVDAEEARAISAETSLSNKIDADVLAEKNRAISVETALNTKIETETTRATSEEQRIETKLDNEISRSTTKDNELQTQINEVASDLSDEISRATNAETQITNNLSEEITRATSTETALNTKIDNEITRATIVEATINDTVDRISQKLELERNERISGDTNLNSKIDSEINRSETKDNELENAINNERTRATSAETTLQTLIEREIASARTEESRIETKIDSEISRARGEENRIEIKFDNAVSGLTNKDEDLQAQISAEVIARTAGDSDLNIAITNEASRASGREDQIENSLNLEIQRAQGAENSLAIQLSAETAARQTEDEHIWRVIRPIEFFDTTTIRNERVRNDGSNPDEVRHSVIIAQADNNIITANDTLGGIYATAKLGYNVSANLLTIYGPDDKIINSVTLGPGSIIKDISYDQAEKDLVITYRRAGDDEDTIMRFPVADLFNEWDVQNPSEGSALELHKVNQTGETGNVDILWGRVLLTGAIERPDGTIDYGDNLIRIVNNGLYVSGSGTSKAQEDIECVKSELNITQENVLGFNIPDCGVYSDGTPYTYPSHVNSCVISAATSMDNADTLLDEAICSLKEEVNCIGSEADNIASVIGVTTNCDASISYPKTQGCLLSSATTFAEADAILEAAVCSIKENVLLGKPSPTNDVDVESEGLNKLIKASTRLSHGNNHDEWQSLDQLTITDYNGGLVETGKGEFTDTNVLRIIDLTESYGYQPQSEYNGLYLSNEWNCGKYYQESTESQEIAEIKESGISDDNIGYTDENPETYNYNYMNNVRQNDIN